MNVKWFGPEKPNLPKGYSRSPRLYIPYDVHLRMFNDPLEEVHFKKCKGWDIYDYGVLEDDNDTFIFLIQTRGLMHAIFASRDKIELNTTRSYITIGGFVHFMYYDLSDCDKVVELPRCRTVRKAKNYILQEV